MPLRKRVRNSLRINIPERRSITHWNHKLRSSSPVHALPRPKTFTWTRTSSKLVQERRKASERHLRSLSSCCNAEIMTNLSNQLLMTSLSSSLVNIRTLESQQQRLLTNIARLQQERLQVLSEIRSSEETHFLSCNSNSNFSRDVAQNLSTNSDNILGDNSKEAGNVSRERNVSIVRTDEDAEAQMVRWLRDQRCDDNVVRKFLAEDLSLKMVLESFDREDLRRLQLKTGPELRIWHAILKHRRSITTSQFNNQR